MQYKSKPIDKKRRGLFPWRPHFPPRVTDAWEQWYRDWIINAPYPAKIEGHRSR